MKIHKLLEIVYKFAKNKWVSWVYLGIITVCIVVIFYKYKEKLTLIMEVSDFTVVPFILVTTIVTILCYIYVQCSIYRELGAKISYLQCFQIIAFAHLGNYMPGRIWFLTNYYILSRRFNIDSVKIGKGFIINNAILLFTGGICSLFAITKLPFLAKEFLIILLLFMALLIQPKILNKLFNFILPKIHKSFSVSATVNPDFFSNPPYKYSSQLRFIGFYFFLWILNGVILYFCILAFEPISIQSFPLILSTIATSMIIGLFAVFAPAGLGVREGIGIMMLSQVTSLKIGALAFILLRITRVIIDILVGGIATIPFIKEKFCPGRFKKL